MASTPKLSSCSKNICITWPMPSQHLYLISVMTSFVQLAFSAGVAYIPHHPSQSNGSKDDASVLRTIEEFTQHDQRNHPNTPAGQTTQCTQPPSPLSPVPSMNSNSNTSGAHFSSVMDDSKSIADSESEWTVNTEAGDSAALKSLSHLHMYQPGASTAFAQRNLRMVSTESFERDRPIHLRKVMLTSYVFSFGHNERE
jgi:hypothetical protein